MDQEAIVMIFQKTFMLVLELAAPVLIVGMVVGLMISVFQTITQIQEATLTFVPKIIACVISLIILLPWMMNVFISGVNELFDAIPTLIG